MNDILVQIGLNDLYGLKASANCADIYRNERDSLKKELEAEKAKREAAEKNLAELQKERDDLEKECDQLEATANEYLKMLAGDNPIADTPETERPN